MARQPALARRPARAAPPYGRPVRGEDCTIKLLVMAGLWPLILCALAAGGLLP